MQLTDYLWIEGPNNKLKGWWTLLLFIHSFFVAWTFNHLPILSCKKIKMKVEVMVYVQKKLNFPSSCDIPYFEHHNLDNFGVTFQLIFLIPILFISLNFYIMYSISSQRIQSLGIYYLYNKRDYVSLRI